MDHAELLRYTVGALERLGVPYLLTGSVASSHYAEPRLTIDIDVVADIPPELVAEFCRAFPATDFYVSEPAVRQAIHRRHQFNIIHPEAGLKVDVMIPDDSAFDRSRLSRRVRVRLEDAYDAWFATPEDVIVKKLEAFREGGSDKHIRDIASLLRVLEARLDRDYVRQWASVLGLTETWQVILSRIGE